MRSEYVRSGSQSDVVEEFKTKPSAYEEVLQIVSVNDVDDAVAHICARPGANGFWQDFG